MSTDSIGNKEAPLVYYINSWLTVSCLDNIHLWPWINPSMSRLWRYYGGSLQIFKWKTTLMSLLEYNQICSNCSINTKPLERFMFNIWFLVCHYYLLRFELIKITVAGCIAVKHTTTLRSGMIVSSGRSSDVIYYNSLMLKIGSLWVEAS